MTKSIGLPLWLVIVGSAGFMVPPPHPDSPCYPLVFPTPHQKGSH